MRAMIVAALSASVLCACVERVEQPSQAQLVERGEYLVTAISGCNDCHSPLTPQGPDMARSLQGAPVSFELLPALQGHVPWAPYAPALAGGPANYTDAQFAHFLQTGERPDGSHALPPMPQVRFNEADARAVVAYIKTLPRAEAAAPATTATTATTTTSAPSP